jgi:predicted dehydrogenase
MKTIGIGIVGCGNICDIYFENAKRFDNITVVGCADLLPERAQEKAEEHELPKAYGSVEEMLADPDVDIIVNLTIPAAHDEVALAALEAGKHVYGEKPLALELAGAREMLDLAAKKDLRVGCAPDTFLGGRLQTARKLIDDGWIGKPVSGTAFMQCPGHESWHPNPGFFYQKGGGPMFDMGPYYLTALVSLLGPVRRTCASTHAAFPQRTMTCEEKFGEVVDVEVPTHYAGVLDFEQGAAVSVVTSFDVRAHKLPNLELHGTTGSLSLGDPNNFGGPLEICRSAEEGWKEVPMSHKYTENSRVLGVADMAKAIQTGRPHRACGELAYHVLEVMHSFETASESGQHTLLESTCQRPNALDMDLPEGILDH